jgi:transcriptional regulator with XRE-family HTH domain
MFLSDVLAANIRAARSRDRRSQEDLAGRMRYLGHDWSRATVSEVERSGRSVSLDEFFALAMALGVSPVDLVMAHGANVDLGTSRPAPAPVMALWLSGRLRIFLDESLGGVQLSVTRTDPPQPDMQQAIAEWMDLREVEE